MHVPTQGFQEEVNELGARGPLDILKFALDHLLDSLPKTCLESNFMYPLLVAHISAFDCQMQVLYLPRCQRFFD